MTHFEVGQPYPNLAPPQTEAGEFLVYDAGLELRAFYPRPRSEEVKAFRNGAASFALAYLDDLIFFLYRFYPLPWAEAVYSQWLVPEERRASPLALEGEQRYLLQVVLADAETGVIRALRQPTLSPETSWALRDLYSRQAQSAPITQAEYQRRASSIQARYQTTELLELAEARR